jgi:hypothetical protein
MSDARQKREAKAACEARRAAWRSGSESYWRAADQQTRQRTAMVIAAFICDEKHDHELADWLLCARPEHARAVATGVAAHALREGITAVWDALVAVDAMDLNDAAELYETEGVLRWTPRPEWLTPVRRPDPALTAMARLGDD